MISTRVLNGAGLLALTVLVGGLAGCRVNVQKDANGKDKNVQVDTPFGGVHVNTDQTTATDLGLPAYPGAVIVTDKDNDKSADIHMGFGQWELRVKAVNYATADSQDKVLAFYKKALAQYGDVIECQNDKPVGGPAVTSQGLSCDEHKHGTDIHVDEGKGNRDFDGPQLKAGSEHRQHIVGFDAPANGQTRFALVEIDLPSGIDMHSANKD